MEEYPKRLYLDDGTKVTVASAAEEALWRHPPLPPDPVAVPVLPVDEPAGKASGKKASGKGATDA